MKTKLNVLVACESSGTVRDAFRALGHNAWSCDLLPCDAAPKYHIQDSIFTVLNEPWKIKKFKTRIHWDGMWDLMIAHPPCTYLANSGVSWLYRKDKTRPSLTGGWDVKKNQQRWDDMEEGAKFFAQLFCADVPHIGVENPIMHCHAAVRVARHVHDLGKSHLLSRPTGRIRPAQYVQPWMFGHPESKATGLHLINLPKLVPNADAEQVKLRMMLLPYNQRNRLHSLPPGPGRWKERSKTFSGIAKAMAEQWSAHVIAEKQKAKL